MKINPVLTTAMLVFVAISPYLTLHYVSRGGVRLCHSARPASGPESPGITGRKQL